MLKIQEIDGKVEKKVEPCWREESLIISKSKVPSLHVLDPLDDQFSKVFSLVRETPGAISYFLQKFVFPKVLKFHDEKISAGAQELGGDILFKRRLGFSGTPNSLLPRGLALDTDPAADAEILLCLTNPEVMKINDNPDKNWTAESILDEIGNKMNCHALIDTGALITGYSNEEVARWFLEKEERLKGMKAVIYLDHEDRKMVWKRGARTAIKLSECEIGEAERFTFYDHVHTTGMDIRQAANAHAVITLGKDMTLRDYAQVPIYDRKNHFFTFLTNSAVRN